MKPKASQDIITAPLAADTRRSTFEIYAQILQICQRPQNKTRIMYKANTSYTAFKKYLRQMQKTYLLQLEPQTQNRYRITERGKIFLQKYNQLKQLLNEGNVSFANSSRFIGSFGEICSAKYS